MVFVFVKFQPLNLMSAPAFATVCVCDSYFGNLNKKDISSREHFVWIIVPLYWLCCIYIFVCWCSSTSPHIFKYISMLWAWSGVTTIESMRKMAEIEKLNLRTICLTISHPLYPWCFVAHLWRHYVQYNFSLALYFPRKCVEYFSSLRIRLCADTRTHEYRERIFLFSFFINWIWMRRKLAEENENIWKKAYYLRILVLIEKQRVFGKLT